MRNRHCTAQKAQSNGKRKWNADRAGKTTDSVRLARASDMAAVYECRTMAVGRDLACTCIVCYYIPFVQHVHVIDVYC